MVLGFIIAIFVVSTGLAAFTAKTTIVAGHNTLGVYNAFSTAAEGHQEPYALNEIDAFKLDVSNTKTAISVCIGHPNTRRWFRRQAKSSLHVLRHRKPTVKLFDAFDTEGRQWLILALQAVMDLYEIALGTNETVLLADMPNNDSFDRPR